MLSTGITKTIYVETGTRKSILEHMVKIEAALNLEREQYKDNPVHWKRNDFADIDNKVLCHWAEEHNAHVRWVYQRFSDQIPKGQKRERITPKQAQEFWHSLTFIHVPIERWTGDYYFSQMEEAYEAMRGRENEFGFSMRTDPLTPEQCESVFSLFAQWMDRHDYRIAVPNDCDHIRNSYYGEYEWCATCGAIDEDHLIHQCATCDKEGCDLLTQFDREGNIL